MTDLGLAGVDFLEYASADPQYLHQYFSKLGMTKVARHKSRSISLYQQHDIRFLLNEDLDSFAAQFAKKHGPSICAMGWRVDNAKMVFEHALSKGAKAYEGNDPSPASERLYAIYGVGDSLIYFVDKHGKETIFDDVYEPIANPEKQDKGLLRIDHLTNNVPKGEMQKWCDFYMNIFGFEVIRYFDIKGEQTGLISHALGAPNRSIIIPINEPTDDKSQIQEYIEEYDGAGIQHIALSTSDICTSLKAMYDEGVKFLDVPDTYYDTLKERIPKLEEDLDRLKSLKVLADGDEEGYLLQLFTKNAIGPIFYEIIQRKNHWGFGAGNFQALFDAIERDQKERGYL